MEVSDEEESSDESSSCTEMSNDGDSSSSELSDKILIEVFFPISNFDASNFSKMFRVYNENKSHYMTIFEILKYKI